MYCVTFRKMTYAEQILLVRIPFSGSDDLIWVFTSRTTVGQWIEGTRVVCEVSRSTPTHALIGRSMLASEDRATTLDSGEGQEETRYISSSSVNVSL